MGAAASVQPSTVVFGECGAGDGSRRGVCHHPRRLPAPAQPALELHAHVLVVALTRSPEAYLRALEEDEALTRVRVDLAEAGHDWLLPRGVKFLVTPRVYPHAMAYLQGQHFCLNGELRQLHQLSRWHLVVEPQFWPYVEATVSNLIRHKVRVKAKTDVYVPLQAAIAAHGL